MTDEEKNIFGNQLRERRNELNLTTQKVALDAEVGESTYKRLEAGDGNPRLDTLVKIVKCLKTDLNSVVPQEHLCKDAGITVYPQVLTNVRVTDKKAAQDDVDVQAAVKKVTEELGDTGRILVRESGTEPVVRVMVEAESEEVCQKYVDMVVGVIEEKGYVTG